MKTLFTAVSRISLLLAIFISIPAASAFYDPAVQRWVNRDPVAESGGANLFKFGSGDPIGRADAFGLFDGIVISDHTDSADPWLWLLQARAGTCFQTDVQSWDQLIAHLEEERAKRNGQPVDTLNISGHGAGPGTGVATSAGNPDLSIAELSDDQLAKLKALFSNKGKLKFWGCGCASRPRSREKLQHLADRLGVEVEAADGNVASGADGLWGWSLGITNPKWYTFRPGRPPLVGSGSGKSKWEKKK